LPTTDGPGIRLIPGPIHCLRWYARHR